jgi:ABC-type sugar transport system permease subunit/ABC-type glycerol-3-phosphate transport system substrate-binding protein
MKPSVFRFLLSLCLCVPAFAGMTAAQAAFAQPVTVRLWGSGGFAIPRKDSTDPWSRANRAVIEDFQKKHPEIRLEVATGLDVQGPANESGLLMAVAGGLSPDVMYVNFRQLENFQKQGFLYPLDEFIAQDPHVMDKIHPGIRRVIAIGGHVYTYPYQQFVQALYYRKDLFRDAGLDPNKPPRTWDEFYDYAKKLTVPDKGQWGFGFAAEPQGTSWWWVNFLWQAGGEVERQLPDGRWVAAFNTPEGVMALSFYKKLVTDEWTLPGGRKQKGVALRTSNIWRDFIEKGKLGMWFQYQSDVVANHSTANISPALIGIAPMPHGPTGKTGNELNASMFGISALQKDPRVRAAAWEFIKYMGSDEADRVRTKAYVEAGLGQFVSPVSLQKYGYEEFISGMSREWVHSMDALFKAGKPEPPGQMIYTELDQPLTEIGLFPDRDPKAILDRAAAKINTKLLGYVPAEVMKKRRQIALGAVTGGFLLILGGVLYMLRRLSLGVAGEPGSRPAGMGSWRYHVVPWCFMGPAVLSIALWAYFPLARGLLMAFQDYRIAQQTKWIGLDNFIEAATQETFWKGILNSFEYVGLSLALGFFLPIILALMLSEVPRGKMLFRTLYYLPAVTSGLVILFLWKQFYDPSPQGLFNQLLGQGAGALNGLFGLAHLPWHLATEAQIDWLGSPQTAMLAVILPGVWAGAGPGSIIYLAALKTISDDLYEAADLDGASVWTKIRTVTLPTLKPLIIINLVGAFIGSFKAMENIFVMTGGGPLYATHTIGLEVWYNAFMYLKFGYATAAAWIMGAMLVGFTLYQLRILRDVRFSAGG